MPRSRREHSDFALRVFAPRNPRNPTPLLLLAAALILIATLTKVAIS